MADIRPFRIAVPDEELVDLRDRLSRTRWPDRECVTDWSQGIPLDYVRELAAYWGDVYDWRAREKAREARRDMSLEQWADTRSFEWLVDLSDYEEVIQCDSDLQEDWDRFICSLRGAA